MHNRTYQRIKILCFYLLLGTIAGCANLSNVGKTALNDKTLPLVTGEQEWQTSEVKVKYEVSTAGNTYDITGKLYIQDKIYYSFPANEFFYFFINYLDKDNRVISSQDISPNLGYKRQFQQNFKLRNIPSPPGGAVSFVFSYWGNFTDSDVEREGTGDWEIYYNPFAGNS